MSGGRSRRLSSRSGLGCLTWRRLAETCRDLPRLAETSRDLPRLAETCRECPPPPLPALLPCRPLRLLAVSPLLPVGHRRSARCSASSARARWRRRGRGVPEVEDGRCVSRLGVRTVRLVGAMSLDQRREALAAFREDRRVRVMLLSLRAGNVGLNLTAARRVFLLDPWWGQDPSPPPHSPAPPHTTHTHPHPTSPPPSPPPPPPPVTRAPASLATRRARRHAASPPRSLAPSPRRCE